MQKMKWHYFFYLNIKLIFFKMPFRSKIFKFAFTKLITIYSIDFNRKDNQGNTFNETIQRDKKKFLIVFYQNRLPLKNYSI